MPIAPARRPIALLGMMGAGKTSVGQALAARLGWPFFDSDAEVEREAGGTVAEIFAREGEAAFRRREARAVAALLSRGAIVLATGGGAMAEPDTRTLLLDRALTIWLDADPRELARRLAGTSGRPLLDGTGREAALARLLDKRRPCYRLAAHHLRTDGLSPDELADSLATTLSP